MSRSPSALERALILEHALYERAKEERKAMNSDTPRTDVDALAHADTCLGYFSDKNQCTCGLHDRRRIVKLERELAAVTAQREALLTALKNVLPVAEKTCERWPNDDIFLVPTHRARAAIAAAEGEK